MPIFFPRQLLHIGGALGPDQREGTFVHEAAEHDERRIFRRREQGRIAARRSHRRLAGNNSRDRRRMNRVNQLDIETVLGIEPRFFGDPQRPRSAASRADHRHGFLQRLGESPKAHRNRPAPEKHNDDRTTNWISFHIVTKFVSAINADHTADTAI